MPAPSAGPSEIAVGLEQHPSTNQSTRDNRPEKTLLSQFKDLNLEKNFQGQKNLHIATQKFQQLAIDLSEFLEIDDIVVEDGSEKGQESIFNRLEDLLKKFREKEKSCQKKCYEGNVLRGEDNSWSEDFFDIVRQPGRKLLELKVDEKKKVLRSNSQVYPRIKNQDISDFIIRQKYLEYYLRTSSFKFGLKSPTIGKNSSIGVNNSSSISLLYTLGSLKYSICILFKKIFSEPKPERDLVPDSVVNFVEKRKLSPDLIYSVFGVDHTLYIREHMEDLHKILQETDEFLTETVLKRMVPENTETRGNFFMKKNDIGEWSLLRDMLIEHEEDRHAEFKIDNDISEKKFYQLIENL